MNLNNNIMKTIRIKMAVLAVLMATVVCGQEITTQHYEVAGYDNIEVSSAIDVRLVADGKEGVTVSCDERLLPAIIIEQRGNKLEIGVDWKKLHWITGRKRDRHISIHKNRVEINGMVFSGGMQIDVSVKHVKAISTSASGDVTWEGDLPADELHLNAFSSGDITWEGTLTANVLHIDCASSGDVEGVYKGGSAFVELSSSGDYEGVMEVETLDAQISSSGDFEGRVNAVKAVFDLSSSGDAEVWGVIDSLYVNACSSAEFNGKKNPPA
ncbi:MAG: hypothetical protein CSA95_01100 [Bacteroidetes bacterium]|nr:MAG: hypothetical protein CSA95_01100 [Bacteroidota bacterium]